MSDMQPISGGGNTSPTQSKYEQPINNWNQFENALLKATGSKSLTIPKDKPYDERTKIITSQLEIIMRALQNKRFTETLTPAQKEEMGKSEAIQEYLKLVKELLKNSSQ